MDRSIAATQLESLREAATAFEVLLPDLDRTARQIVDCLRAGGQLLTCGNGGSAAESLHLAEELTGRYRGHRRAWPAIALVADTTALTCIANDFGYAEVFARQIEAYGRPGDILIAFSCSGNSPNVLRALEVARARGLRSILLSGLTGGAARVRADEVLAVPSSQVAQVQEMHLFILHTWLEYVEAMD